MGCARQVLEGVLQEMWWLQFKVLLPQKLLLAETAENGNLSCPGGLRLLPDYYLMCELWLELVQVQASFAPAMPLWVRRAATALSKLLPPVNISQAICFPLGTRREQG